jgi:hypothetical protein
MAAGPCVCRATASQRAEATTGRKTSSPKASVPAKQTAAGTIRRTVDTVGARSAAGAASSRPTMAANTVRVPGSSSEKSIVLASRNAPTAAISGRR